MAYSDFTPQELTRRFNIRYRAEKLFPTANAVMPSAWLVEGLKKGQELGFGSEKSRSERLVTPVLMELSDRNNHSFSIYSGLNLDVDPTQGLNGECDFIFSFNRIQDFVTAPIFCITEAKKQDLEQGTIQCAAQLIAARRFNDLAGNHLPPTLYGCSTTGVEWRFLKYDADEIIVDEERYLIRDLDKLLGALQHVIEISRPFAESR